MSQIAQRISHAVPQVDETATTSEKRDRGPWLFLLAPLSFVLTLATVMLLAP